MTKLTVSCEPGTGPLEVSVYPPTGDAIEFTLSSGKSEQDIDASPGRYVVVGRRLNGARLRTAVDVGDTDVTAWLPRSTGPSPNEFMEPETRRGQVRLDVAGIAVASSLWRAALVGIGETVLKGALSGLVSGLDSSTEAPFALGPDRSAGELGLQAWSWHGGAWHLADGAGAAGIDPQFSPQVSGDFLKVSLLPRTEARCLGLLDEDGFGPMVFVPPFADPLSVTFLSKGVYARAADRERSPGRRRVPVAIATPAHSGVADMLTAIASSATPQAEDIWDQTLTSLVVPTDPAVSHAGSENPDTAISMLLEKFIRPAEALLAAHYLLRYLPEKLPLDWADNLSHAMPDAADGPIIAAWIRVLNRPSAMSDEQVNTAFQERVALALQRPLKLFARTRLLIAEAQHLSPDAASKVAWAQEEMFRRRGAEASGLESFWGGGPDHFEADRNLGQHSAALVRVMMNDGLFGAA